MKIALDKNIYFEKFNSYEFETLPQHKGFMDASRKNINYTLRNIFLVNKLFQNSDLKRYHSYNFKTSPQHKAFMDMSMKYTNYTLIKIHVSKRNIAVTGRAHCQRQVAFLGNM